MLGNSYLNTLHVGVVMPLPQKLNVRKALKAKIAGQSYRQIAEAQGVDKSTVHQTLAPLLKALPNANELSEMRSSMADHLTVTAYKTIASITDEDFAKAGLQQKATSAAILIDKSRLISGESTQNIAVLVSSAVREGGIEMAGTVVDDEI